MPDTPEVDALVAALEAAHWPSSDFLNATRCCDCGHCAPLRREVASNADALLPILAAHAGPSARAAALRVLLEERIGAMADEDGDVCVDAWNEWFEPLSQALDRLAPEAPDGA